ncbi:MAG TPA: tetratricopeptide repeat protein, partial [Sedimentisphaerales bacterium]|nr:tetratricopeptide repeat protein [Sedimentisphaerales bacterium]
MLETSRKSQVVVIYIVLILGTLAVFWQVRDFDFVNFDDGCYVFENPHVRSGLSLANVVWAFTSGHAFNWHPLTWLSHMLDSHLFGVDPGRMHLVNVFFHIANTLLLFILLKDMTGSILQSAFVAAAFALHPTRVESVAWISQRKDVLSTFFLLLTLYSYRGYSVRPSAARYLLALSFFALGLMSKPMLVTLPFLLLLLDYWPLERFSFQPAASPRGRSRAAAAGVSGYPSAGRLVIEKLPFFVLAAIASVVTFLVQRAGGAVVDIDLMPLDARVSNALVSYVRYIGLMLWPSNLAVLYPLGRDRIAFWQAGASFLLLVAISILAIWFGRQRKYLPVGWFWFVGMLVPVIGLVQVGSQALADRYTYMPYTGLFIIVAWGVSELSAKIAHRKVILWGLAAAIFATLGILAHKQTGYWRDGMTLFTRAIAVTRDNNVAHSNRGNIHAAAGRFEEAAADFRRAIEIKPNYAEAHSNLGNVLGSKGRLQEAMESYMRALRSNPLLAEAHYGMGLIHGKLGRWQEAAEAFGRSVEIRPSNAAGQHNLGVAYGLLGRSDDAIAAHKRALAINPHLASARYNLGIEFGNAGRLQEGIEVFTGLLQSDPRHPGVHRELGIIYSRAGRWQEAAEAFGRSVEIRP